MAIANSGSWSATQASSASWTVNVPSGASANDACIVAMSQNNANTVTASAYTTHGFTLIGELDSGSGDVLVLIKILTAGDISAGSWTFTNIWNSASDAGVSGSVSYSGVDTVTPQSGGPQQQTSTVPECDGFLPNDDNSMIVGVFGRDPGATQTGTSSWGTERVDLINSGTGYLYIVDKLQTTATDENATFTPNPSGFQFATFQIALKEGAAGNTASPSKGDVDFTGFAPTASITVDNTSSPTKGEVVFAGFAPNATKTENITVSPPRGSVVFSSAAPTAWVSIDGDITIQVDAPEAGMGQIAFTGKAPSLDASETVSPSKGVVAFTGLTPTVTTPLTISPSAVQVSFTGRTPSRLVNYITSPSVVQVQITGFAPAVTVTTQNYAFPSKGDVVFSGFVPTVTGGVATAVPAAVIGGVGKRRRRRLYRLPDGKLVYATPEELRQIAAMYEEEAVDIEPELKSYPRNYRRKQLRKYRTKAVDAPLVIQELEEEADIQYVLKEIAKSLR